MKNLLTLLSVFVIALCSCKKNYNCICTTTSVTKTFANNGSSINTYSTTIISQTTIDDTKSSASSKCSAMSQSSANPPVNCAIN
jgi:hypothetical protein